MVAKIEEIVLIWLSIIDEINYIIFLKLLKAFNQIEDLFVISNNKLLFREILIQNNVVISNKLFNSLTNIYLKEKAVKIYNNLVKQKIQFISFFSKEYPLELKGMLNAPLILFTFGKDKNLNLSNKKIYLYASNKEQVKLNKRVLEIYNSIISSKDLITVNIKSNKKYNLIIYSDDILNENYVCNEFKSNFLYYIVPKTSTYKEELICAISDGLIILNSRFEKNVLKLTTLMLELGKEIYVIPGSISDENYSFSNYLIKDGANVILNKKDIINYFKD